MIDCNTAVERLWDFIEQDLEDTERNQMDEHLAFCRRCCGEVEFTEEIRSKLKAAARPVLPSDVEGRLVQFIAGLDEEGA